MSTGIPSIDFVIDALPAAEGMLDSAGQPELAALIAALGATLKAASDAYEAKGFNLATALSAADAAAMAELLLKFPKG
jgi:hypothetical protein